jgi:predicted enzyme related to lactoylglutathione lyase
MALGHLSEVVIDCHDPDRLAAFWQAMVGGDIVDQDGEWVAVVPDRGIVIGLQRVPEGKVAKNRVHLDVQVDDLEVAAHAAVALGATRRGGVHADPLGRFVVMLDPEGNEFCFVTDP